MLELTEFYFYLVTSFVVLFNITALVYQVLSSKSFSVFFILLLVICNVFWVYMFLDKHN